MRLHGKNYFRVLLLWFATGVLLTASPLVGCALQGKPLSPYLQLPPLTFKVSHAGFSWGVFAFFAVIDLVLLAGISAAFWKRSSPQKFSTHKKRRLPPWGWIGVVVLLTGWLLAWTRFEFFTSFQKHTFCLPWIGYIILVNALCCKRSGTCLPIENPAGFVLLFPASAVFWWFFEFLNRFVQNWYYIGVSDFSPAAYTLFASLAFATVLPAVLSTYRLLLTWRSASQKAINVTKAVRGKSGRRWALFMLLCACAGLALLDPFADQLFALVWVAPLVVLFSLQVLFKHPTVLESLPRGDWSPLVVSSLAALVCGFFWELWNMGSLAQWVYSVPYVDRFHLFKMPVVGYGGYFPFGITCAVVCHMLLGPSALALDMDR